MLQLTRSDVRSRKHGTSFATETPEQGACNGSRYSQAEEGDNDLRLPYARSNKIRLDKCNTVECCMNGDEENDEPIRDEVSGEKLFGGILGEEKLRRRIWIVRGEQIVNR